MVDTNNKSIRSRTSFDRIIDRERLRTNDPNHNGLSAEDIATVKNLVQCILSTGNSNDGDFRKDKVDRYGTKFRAYLWSPRRAV